VDAVGVENVSERIHLFAGLSGCGPMVRSWEAGFK
jgi:hypothetical protein